MRLNKVAAKRRTKFFAWFIDLAKAYDSVPRCLLIEKMIKLGLDQSLIRIIAEMLTKTFMTVNDEKFEANMGCL